MSELFDPDERIRKALAASWSSNGYKDALQAIAEGIRSIAGFGVAAVSVRHETGEFECVAVAGPEDAVRELVGHFNPEAPILEQFERGIDWGRFRFIPHDMQVPESPYTWVPDVVYPASEDAWHVDNMLIAPLLDGDGQLCGMLAVDVPEDGLVPSPARRWVLNRYAEQAEQAVARALERERLAQQLRMAETARAIVRRAGARLSPREVLEECRDGILEGFRVQGLWLQVFDDRQSLVTDAAGNPVDLPGFLSSIAERAARACWRQQQVALLSRSRSTHRVISDRDRARVLDFLDQIGVSSLMCVPIGAGPECLGNLVLTRNDRDVEWTDAEARTALDLGHDLGSALLNARLFDRDQQLVEQLRAMDDYKSKLIATIAHEFKNPLSAIIGHIELVEDDPKDAELVQSSAATIRRGAQRLVDLVGQLLDLRQASDPLDRRGVTRVDLNEVVQDQVDLLGGQASRRQQQLVASYDAEPCWVSASRSDLETVCANLMTNALKYSPEGGRVVAGVRRRGDRVVLEVTDQGLGISAEDQERLFEEFFRSSNPRAQEQPGTGLGLAIVARVVERAGGRILLSSALGEGSTFAVQLPAAVSVPEPVSAAQVVQ